MSTYLIDDKDNLLVGIMLNESLWPPDMIQECLPKEQQYFHSGELQEVTWASQFLPWKKNFIIASSKGLETTSMKSSKLSLKCSLCFLLRSLTETLFLNWCPKVKRTESLGEQCPGGYDPHSVFLSLLAGGRQTRWKMYVLCNHLLAEDKAGCWKRWGLLAGLVW